MSETDFNILLERLHHLETGYKGFTTRIRLIEAELDRIRADKDER